MASNRLVRRQIPAAIGGAAIIAMIGFTAACASDSDEPEESPTTTTTEPTLTPTEKSINPTGGNVFTPPVTAPQQTVQGPND